MKTLWIARHAEAANGINDSKRRLTAQGQQQARQTGRDLCVSSPNKLHVMCSGATRATQTLREWQKLSDWKGSETFHNGLYLANSGTLLHHICRVEDRIANLCILAHNPGVSDLIHYLTRGIHHLQPGDIVQTSCNIKSWQELSEGFGDLIRIFKPKS